MHHERRAEVHVLSWRCVRCGAKALPTGVNRTEHGSVLFRRVQARRLPFAHCCCAQRGATSVQGSGRLRPLRGSRFSERIFSYSLGKIGGTGKLPGDSWTPGPRARGAKGKAVAGTGRIQYRRVRRFETNNSSCRAADGYLAEIRRSDTERKEGRGPLFVSLGGQFGGIALLAVRAGAIKCPDGIGFEFDNELLDDMLDTFAFAGGNFDCAIVLVRGQFALHEYVSAFH